MKTYEDKKDVISVELQNRKQLNQGMSLNKSTSNLFRARKTKPNEHKIDVKNFNKVIHVDEVNLTADVEGMTTYADLVSETLKYFALPTVVPELKSITVGGAIAGCGIESSSFRYGLVHETVLEMDVLLSDGNIVTCTPTNEHKDLFYAMPNTFGTLGYILRAKIKLIPATQYVKLTHFRFSDSATFFDVLRRKCQENLADYIEGVIFDQVEMYITVGEFVNEAPFVSNYRYKNIYYRSIQKKKTDYLTTLDYIWRWDTDWFWCSKVFFMQNPVMRLLFGKFLLNSTTYAKIMHFFNRHPMLSSITSMGKKTESIIQDVLIPVNEADAFYEFLRSEIGIKPIWVCPAKSYSKKVQFDFCPLDPERLYLDFGFWDRVESDREEGFYNRKIEKIAEKLGGFKSLYSSSYYAREEFWKLFDQRRYEELKHKYDPNANLKGLYEKCVKV